MARRMRTAFDPRLLAHHPAGQACLAACQANGWEPQSGDVVRLVRLWDEVHQGRRSEASLSPNRLAFARWLVEHGRIGEGLPEGAELLVRGRPA